MYYLRKLDKMYIHQQREWPVFRFDAEQLATPLAQVRHLQGWLLGRVADWGIQTRLESSASATVNEIISNSLIEGEQLPAGEVRSSVARRLGLPTAGLISPTHQVDGVVEMMLDATQNYDKPVTEDRLFDWHAALFPTGRSGMAKITVGAYRNHPDTEPMQVISGRWTRTRIHFEAPSSTTLGEEMQQLFDYINKPDSTDGLLRAGIAHLWFLTLHPFDDGNGRMARALTDLLLARSDRSQQRFYSISTAILNQRKYYYRQLETAQKGGLDITNWLLWFLDTVADAINLANEQLSDVFSQAQFWRRHQETVLNARQKQMISKLWSGYQGKLTSFRYAKFCHVSQDTAIRDINDLVAKGILEKGLAGGRATAYDLIRN